MVTVPTWAWQIATCSRPPTAAVVTVGRNSEVDVDVARDLVGDDEVRNVVAYWDRCRELLADPDALTEGDRAAVIRRTVVQRTTSSSCDLTPQLQALQDLPLLKPVINELTSINPDLDALAAAGLPTAIEIRRDGALLRTRMYVTGRQPWSPALGGAAWTTELRRVIDLSARHESWRRYRRERLQHCTVHVDERWPAPTGRSMIMQPTGQFALVL